MTFRITALPPEPFAPLFALSEAGLPADTRRVVAGEGGGYPCRVSLIDAAPGETLLLTHFEHQPATTPFRAGHAIYVRADARRAAPSAGTVPALFRTRLLSLRGFDAADMLHAAEVADGTALEAAIEEMFGDGDVAYIHLHLAKPGCYAARVDRA